MWQQYYEPQIAARNRWVEHGHTQAADLPRRSPRPAAATVQAHPTGVRTWFAAAGAAAGSAAIAVLGVLGLHVDRAQTASAAAPAPALHAAPDATAAGSGIAE